MIKAVLFDNDGVLSKWFVPRPAVRRLAKSLPKHNIKVGMLSNVGWGPAQVHKLSRAYHGFDVLVLSYRDKLKKPDTAIYELAIKKLGVKPEEVLFIDDKKHWVDPATNLGVKTIHAVSAKQILKDIKKVLEQENKIKL